MVFGRRKKQQSNTSSTSSFFRSPENSCLKHPTGSRNPRHSKPQHLHVQFGPVYIREYERVIGCNPSCSNGAPIGIGWRFIDLETPVSIQAMELNPNRRRHKVDLVLSRQERESLLIEWGFTLPEIVESIRATIRIKHQRRRTVNNARYERVWEDVVVKPASRIKRKFRNKNANTKLHDPDQHTMNVPVHAHDYDSAIDSVDSSYGEDRGVDVQPKIPVRYEDSTESMEDDSRLFTLEQEDAVVYVNHDDVQEDISSATTLGSDGNFEFLSRDTSFWELERNNSLYPKIARKAVAIVVSDEPMDDYSSEEGTFGHPPMVLSNHNCTFARSRWG